MRQSLVGATGLRPVFPVLMPVFPGIGPVKIGLDGWRFVCETHYQSVYLRYPQTENIAEKIPMRTTAKNIAQDDSRQPDAVVLVKMPGCLADYFHHHLGSPICFPPRSAERDIIARGICRRHELQGEESDGVPVGVFRRSDKRIPTDPVMSEPGRKRLLRAMNGILTAAVWTAMLPEFAKGRGLNAEIDRWCADNGIAIDHREAVRQRLYRLRRQYASLGIVIGRQYKEKC